MPFLSIKDAASAAGISRTAFYKQYILPGKISVNRADPKKPCVDTSEILRVFGSIQGDRQATADKSHKSPSPAARINELEHETAAQRAEIGGLRAALAAKDDHIQTLKNELAAARDREIRLLPQPQKGFFTRLFGGGS